MSTSNFAHKAAELRQLVAQSAGQRLPGERELAALLQLSRPRVRALLAELEAEGLIQRRQGSGTIAVDTSTQHIHTVALLIDEQLKLGDDPFFSWLLECLQATLQAEGMHCVIERIGSHKGQWHLQDAAITFGQAGESVIANLRPDDPPVVGLLLDPQIRAKAQASIFQLADKEAGEEAAQYLVDTQCRVMIFVGKQDIAASRERLAGVEAIARRAGIEVLFVPCALNYVAGLKLGKELNLPVTDRPVGIIATNDWLALGLQAGLFSVTAARQRDIRMVSFDGLSMTTDASSGIRSLQVPIDSIAHDAVAELRRLRQSRFAVGRIVSYQLHW